MELTQKVFGFLIILLGELLIFFYKNSKKSVGSKTCENISSKELSHLL